MNKDIKHQELVLKKLAEAWDLYLQIPDNEKHQSDNDEFLKAIHTAQNIMYYQAFVKRHGQL